MSNRDFGKVINIIDVTDHNCLLKHYDFLSLIDQRSEGKVFCSLSLQQYDFFLSLIELFENRKDVLLEIGYKDD